MRRRGFAVVLVIGAALALAGCGDFRERAMETQQMLEDTQQAAETAEQAAAQNTGRIRELEDRVDSLEARLDSLQNAAQKTDESPETAP